MPEKLKKLIESVQKTGCLPDGTRSCLLCLDPCINEAMYVGVWIADSENQLRLGYSKEKLKNGGKRVIVYQLCPACFDQPTRSEDVETNILKSAGVQ